MEILVRLPILAFAAVVAAAAPAAATFHDVTISPIPFDRWMYPFNGTPATRNLASTFSAVYADPDSFDNKDATLILAVNTVAAGIPAGQGAANYLPVAVRVRVTHFEGEFLYDPTYDAWQTYLAPNDPNYVADSDPGHPIELYGVGLRNGYTLPLVVGAPGPAGPPGFGEGERYCESSCGGLGQGIRNAFPYDPGAADPLGDVSNNVRRRPPLTGGSFDPFPWALGISTSGLDPGDPVPQGVFDTSPGETFEFDVELGDPGVLAYVRQGLDVGVLAFAITSMHTVEQQVGGTNPNFYNRESTDTAAVKPSMEIVTVVPEPGFAAGVASSVGMLAWLDRRRARRAARAGGR
jgi:hypothetical protein